MNDPWERFLDDEEFAFGPYSEDYSKLPIPDSKVWSVAGTVHHPECGFQGRDMEDCNCKELYTRDYEADKEAAAEELHEEYWQ